MTLDIKLPEGFELIGNYNNQYVIAKMSTPVRRNRMLFGLSIMISAGYTAAHIFHPCKWHS